MTTLIVRPLDPSAPGSWRKRRRILEAAQAAQRGADVDESGDAQHLSIDAALAVEDILLLQLSTDDGSPVEDVLDKLSINEFNDIYRGLLSSSVPQKSAANS